MSSLKLNRPHLTPLSASRPLQRALLGVSLISPLCVSALTAPRLGYAAPRASELALMSAKANEVERVARDRIEQLFSRLCPGRCELIEVKAQISEPKPVGQVMPGFAAPVASEVKVRSIDAKVMIDSSLPRSFRSNLPQMVQHRLSDLSSSVIVSPIQLEFPKPQLPPSPPMMPEARPQAPAPAPAPPPAEEPKVEEPKAEPVVAAEPLDEPLSLLEALPYLLALALFGLLALVWSRLNKLQRQLAGAQEGSQGRGAEPPFTSQEGAREPHEREGSRAYPNLDELRARLNTSRGATNEALRRWLKEDVAEVASLTRMLGASVLSDLKRDPECSEPLERVSELVRRERAPVSAERAWTVAHSLESRLTASELLEDDRALKGAWGFLHGLSVAELYELYRPLGYAQQSHLVSQLPTSSRAPLLSRLSSDERQALVLYASAEAPLSRAASLELAQQLKGLAQERSGLTQEASAHAELALEMVSAMPSELQAQTLLSLEAQRPALANSLLSELCLEGTLTSLPVEVLTEALILTPFNDALAVLRSSSAERQHQLISALPAQRATLYLDELESPQPVDDEQAQHAWASFLQRVREATKRAQLDLAQLNRATLQQWRA